MKKYKRRSKVITYIISALVLIALIAGCSGADADKSSGSENTGADEEPKKIELFAMDTYMTLTAYGENADEALAESEKEIKRIDAMLSTGKDDSEISKLNKEGELEVSEETLGLIKRAKEIGEETGGVFDISVYPVMRAWGFTDKNYRVPDKDELKELLKLVDFSRVKLDEKDMRVGFDDGMAIDLGGIAKGYTSDRVIEIMKEHGIEHALINLGGNVKVLGGKPDGSDWKVAIIDPEDMEKYIGGVAVKDKAVITSGGYQRFFEQDGERYFHIIDLTDGFPAKNGLISTTVVTDDGTLGDALSTSLFIMGPEKAVDYWREHADDFDAVLVKDDGSILVTEGLEDSYFAEKEYEVVKR